MILQGSDLNHLQSVTTRQSEDEDVLDDEEQENLKKMKEKVRKKYNNYNKDIEQSHMYMCWQQKSVFFYIFANISTPLPHPTPTT